MSLDLRPRRLSEPESGIDGLYDLAWHLTGDERRAQDLLLIALQAGGCSGTGNGRGGADLRGRLVRAYLGQRPPSRPFGRFVDRRIRRAANARGERPDFEAGLASLRPAERACLVLRERLGLPVTEVARLTGLGEEDTRRALFHARERLRASLHRLGMAQE